MYRRGPAATGRKWSYERMAGELGNMPFLVIRLAHEGSPRVLAHRGCASTNTG